MQKSTNVIQRIALFMLSLVFSAGVVLAQERTVRGTVTAEDEGPLPGVNIFIQGTTVGTISDLDGSYQLEVPGPDAVLVFSSVGYETQTATVGDRSVIDIVLVPDVTALQEVVVTGYTTQSRRNVSGAISSVEPEEIQEMPVSNMSQALQGRAPGVNVTYSGEPGGGIQLRIRGFGTINNNNPLYILDGTPVSAGDIQALNPNDVESIQILKDASTASIYGARAANGVVIITTKKGRTDRKTSVTFDSYVGLQQPSNIPELLNPQELADVLWAAQQNAGFSPTHQQYGSGASPTLPNYIIPTAANSADESAYDFEDNPITRANKEGTDWLDEIFEPASIQSYNVTAQGGSDMGQYSFSLGYFNQDGVVIHTGYNRYSMRLNTLFNIGDRLRVGETFMLAFEDRNGISGGRQGTGNAISMAFRMPSLIPVYDVGGNFAGTRAAGFNNPNNPVASQILGKDNINQFIRTIGSIFAELDVIEGLTLKTSFNTNFGMTYRNQWFGFRGEWNAEPSPVNSLNEYRSSSLNWTWYNTLTYNKTFADVHNVQVLVGTEAIENTWSNLQGARVNYFSENPIYRVLNAGEGNPTNSGGLSEWTLFSLFGKVDYDFDGKYILSATVRRDGSSRFGADNRFAVFPAFSAAWRLSDESFMQGVTAIDDLKLRFGWGQTGNQEIGTYTFASTFGPSVDFSAYDITGSQNNVVVGFDSRVFGNPDVKWETTTTLDIGFDLAMLNNRLGIEFDWYQRTTTDMLLQVPVSSLAGIASNPFRNVGEMENNGMDIGINWDNRSPGDFNWSIGANLTMYKNEVVKLVNEDQNIDNGGFRSFAATRTTEGQPIGSYYGYRILGVFMSEEEVNNHISQAGAAVGRWKYEDVNGDGELTADDRDFLGSPHPDLIFGVPMKFSYRNLTLDLFWNGTFGNELFNANLYWTSFVQTFQNSQKGKDILDSWGFQGQNQRADARLPEISQNAPSHEIAPSTYYIQDGSYVRLKQLILGYNVPTANLNWIQNLRVYFQAVNLLTFTDYNGIDPEVSTDNNVYGGGADLDIGVDRGQYPVVKNFQLGLNVTF